MEIEVLKKYVETLKYKGSEILGILPSVDVKDSLLRDLIINFNNIFTNIQQYEMLIKEFEEELNEVKD